MKPDIYLQWLLEIQRRIHADPGSYILKTGEGAWFAGKPYHWILDEITRVRNELRNEMKYG